MSPSVPGALKIASGSLIAVGTVAAGAAIGLAVQRRVVARSMHSDADWYLPSRDELLKIRNNEHILTNKLENVMLGTYQGSTEFISSSENFYGPIVADFWGQQGQGPVNYNNSNTRNYDYTHTNPSIMIIRSFAFNKSGDLNIETSESIKSKLSK